jgi:hypothetical protein
MRSFGIDRAMAARVSVVASVLVLALTQAALAGSTSAPGAPTVATGTSRAVGFQVQLDGSINPNGEATTYYFQYGPTLAYGSQTTTENLAAGTSKDPVSQLVSGVLPGYHYRLVASNAKGTANGHDHVYVIKKSTSTTKAKSPTSKKPTLAFTVSKPPAEGQVVGSSLTITGTLTGPGATGHQIVLQASPYPSSAVFTNVGAPVTVNATGRFSFFVAHLTRSTRYRVATVGLAPIYSQVITALATVRVTLHVRTARSAGLVRLYGTVSPAVTGATVFFQVQEPPKPHTNNVPAKPPKNQKAEEKAEEKAEQAETPKYATEFSVPVKRATKTFSRFSIVEAIRKTGLYRAYVEVPKGPLASSHSSNIELHAAPTKKKSKSKG